MDGMYTDMVSFIKKSPYTYTCNPKWEIVTNIKQVSVWLKYDFKIWGGYIET